MTHRSRVACNAEIASYDSQCSDITNMLVGISGETVPKGGNLCIYYAHSAAIYEAVVQIHSWCVTPHSSPTRGCWPLQIILNILNIFTINIDIWALLTKTVKSVLG